MYLPPPIFPFGSAPSFWVVGLGGPAPCLCHVCHPPGPQEHLSKIPCGRGRAQGRLCPPSLAASARREQETKVAFFSFSRLAAGPPPAPSGSWQPCLRGRGGLGQTMPARDERGPVDIVTRGLGGPVGWKLAPGVSLLVSGTCPPPSAIVTIGARGHHLGSMALEKTPRAAVPGVSPLPSPLLWLGDSAGYVCCPLIGSPKFKILPQFSLLPPNPHLLGK